MPERRGHAELAPLPSQWSYFMKSIGYVLVVLYTCLISIVLYAVFYEIAPAYYNCYKSYTIGGVIDYHYNANLHNNMPVGDYNVRHFFRIRNLFQFLHGCLD